MVVDSILNVGKMGIVPLRAADFSAESKSWMVCAIVVNI